MVSIQRARRLAGAFTFVFALALTACGAPTAPLAAAPPSAVALTPSSPTATRTPVTATPTPSPTVPSAAPVIAAPVPAPSAPPVPAPAAVAAPPIPAPAPAAVAAPAPASNVVAGVIVPGAFCRNADVGMRGLAANGRTYTCGGKGADANGHYHWNV